MYLVPNLMDPGMCRLVREAMDRGYPEPAEVLGPQVAVVEAVRRAMQIEVDRDVLVAVEQLLDAQRETVAAFYGLSLTEREGAGFLRYEAGGFYGAHRDRASLPSWPGASRRQIAVVLFLNDGRNGDRSGDFSGGALRLFPDDDVDEPIVIVPRCGTLVAFPATMLHDVTPIIDGRRDTVVDWYYGPPHGRPHEDAS